MPQRIYLIIFWWFCLTTTSFSQLCIGGNIYTNDAFVYGRFEVAMQSAAGDGIVSSFFLYNLDAGCDWPDENNEIDIEMTGNAEDVYFTTHYPGPWFYSDTYSPSFNPHESIHEYAFEWEPGIVRWFIDGELVNVQNQPFVEDLIYPMRIMMNLWAAEAEEWVGVWDPSIMPVESVYDYVRYYYYTPGTGNSGTGNNYSLSWQDDFTVLDQDRWTVEEEARFEGNFCTFKYSSVVFDGGYLYLQLEEVDPNPPTIPVTFSVNVSDLDLEPTDIIYLNGSLNDWCGTCNPMTPSNDVWSITVDLEPGKYEYLFTKNFWEENGGAPVESECDFNPCDQYGNYGLTVMTGSEPIILDTPCWATCIICETTSVVEPLQNGSKKLLKIFDQLGREVTPTPGQLLFYLYNDGSVEARYFFD